MARPSGRPGYCLFVARLESARTLKAGSPAVCAVIGDPDAVASLPLDRLQATFGPSESSGDDLTVHLPGGEELRLTRVGRTLEGAMGGETVRFVRR